VDKLQPLGDGWFSIEHDGRRRRFAVVHTSETAWVFVDGDVFMLAAADNTTRARSSRGSGEVMAPMPATVVAIHATVGAPVSEGETVIVLEAMKMELPLKSPRSGTIKAINCAKGELVQPGVLLVDVE